MKKQILAMLLAVLMFSVVGCTNTESGNESTDQTADTTTVVEETAPSISPAEVDALPTTAGIMRGRSLW